MPKPRPGKKTFSVTLSTEEHAFLVRLSTAYKGMSVDGIARIFIAYAIPRSAEAMGLPAAEALKEKPVAPEEP